MKLLQLASILIFAGFACLARAQDPLTLISTSPQSTEDHPTITQLNGMFYIAAKAKGSTKLYVMYSGGDAKNFGVGIISRQASHFAPSIATFQNQLYIAWTGTDKKISVAQVPIANGKPGEFTNVKTSAQTAESGPTLFATADALYLVWRGSSGNDQISVAKVNAQ